jgi:hypothetical protein
MSVLRGPPPGLAGGVSCAKRSQLAFALRFQGRKRVDNADEIRAEIVA